MKYESDILKTIHESAIEKFQLGIISEAEMRKHDELCLTPKALKDKTANMEHADLAAV